VAALFFFGDIISLIDATLKYSLDQVTPGRQNVDKYRMGFRIPYAYHTGRDPTINSPPAEIVTNTKTQHSGWLCFR